MFGRGGCLAGVGVRWVSCGRSFGRSRKRRPDRARLGALDWLDCFRVSVEFFSLLFYSRVYNKN